MKIALLALMGIIVIALFVGLFFLMREKGDSRKALSSLMVRVGMSVFLILLLILSIYMGWITPHGVGE